MPFVRERYRELLMGAKDQHGWCSDIPREHKDKPVLSIVRNPYDSYVSAYTFGWWKKDFANQVPNGQDGYFQDAEAVKQKYPEAPNWEFPQFLAASWEFSLWVRRTLDTHPDAANLGMYTHRFVYFYCRDHDYVFDAAHDPKRFLERVKECLYDVHFLRQENLNQGLHEFLQTMGYSREHLEFMLQKEKINVSRKDTSFNKFYSDGLKQEVRKKDAIIFELFPEYDD